ncbi:MAG: hypothetical protein CFE38_12750 [Comamonadaceae bacterium PBBC1]|nr:MAG: hypothetical protein CFE38_12750 [Comamonadaceae bacterium PBBC1]
MQAIPDVVIKNGRIVTAHEAEHRRLYKAAWLVATLLAAGMGGYLFGQYQATPPTTTPSVATLSVWPAPVQPTSSLAATAPTTPLPQAAASSLTQTRPSPTNSTSTLQAAVSASLQNVSPPSGNEKQFVQAQQDYLRQSQETPEQVKAHLDRLATQPDALQAHNRSVTNRVTATASHASTPDLEKAVLASHKASQALPTQDALTGALKKEATLHEAEAQTYVVRTGDTLWAIARRMYGDPHQYKRLFEANPRVLAAPEHIFPGQVLRVPA